MFSKETNFSNNYDELDENGEDLELEDYDEDMDELEYDEQEY